MVGPSQLAIPSPTLTGVEGVGSNDATQPTQGSISYKPPGAPTDMSAGDWAQVGTLGNHVAVLEGGVALLGSPAAHVQSIGPSGTLRQVARRFQQFTDFGQVRIENDQGKTSYVLRAGSNQSTQTGMDEQHWTIRLDLGATGDVLDFRILEPEGKLLFRLHAGSDGRVQIYGDGGVDLSAGANGNAEMRHDIAGSHTTAVAGSTTHTVQGNATTTVDQVSTVSVGGDHVHSVGGNATMFVGGAHDLGVSGSLSCAVGGKRVTQVGGDDQATVEGSVSMSAGETLMVDGQQVQLGASATDPVIGGTRFQNAVMSPLGAAGSALGQLAQQAQVVLAPDVVSSTPTVATITALTALITGLTALGGSLTALAAAYPATLSTKVKTE
jgi:hypothetical protein